MSQFAQDFWEPQNCWFLPFAAQVSQLFFATLDFGVFMAMLWFGINLCVLRMRQWREHKHFLALVKPDQGADPSENETNVRRKKPTKKKIKQEEAVFCFYCVLLLPLLCQEKPTGTNSCLFICWFYSFRLQKTNQVASREWWLQKMHDENTDLEFCNHNLLWGCSLSTDSVRGKKLASLTCALNISSVAWLIRNVQWGQLYCLFNVDIDIDTYRYRY